MHEKLTLDLDELTVASFEPQPVFAVAAYDDGGGISWPGMCSCIGICPPTADIACLTSVPTQPTIQDQQAY